jgi:hypothetical protein
VRSVGVVLDAPRLDNDLGPGEGAELLDVQERVAHRPLKLSMKGFSHGAPGSM